MQRCPYCGNETDRRICPKCEVPVLPGDEEDAEMPAEDETGDGADSALPMNWHGFLVYCGFWLEAIGYGALGLNVLLNFVDVVSALFAVVFIGLAAWTVYVRNQLARLKRGAPAKLVGLYIGTMLLGILLMLATGSGNWTSLLTSAIVPVLNCIYYGKRSKLFVN